MEVIDNEDGTVTIHIGNYMYVYQVPKDRSHHLTHQGVGEDILDVIFRITKEGKKISSPEKELWTTPKYMNLQAEEE